MNTINTARLVLRRWAERDLDPFAALNADPQVMEHFPSTHTREQTADMIARIEKHFDENDFGLWAAELNCDGSAFADEGAVAALKKGTLIGFIGLQKVPFEAHFTPAVEVGWRLAKECWGHGLAPEGAEAAIDDILSRFDFPEIISMTATTNRNSMRVMEKLGMSRNPLDDFDHPRLPNHRLCRHVLYRISKDQWITKGRNPGRK